MKIKLIDGTTDDTDQKNDIDALSAELSHNLVQEFIKYDIPIVGVFITSKGTPRFITHVHSFEQNKVALKGQLVKEIELSEMDQEDWELYKKRATQLISGIKFWIESLTQGNVTVARKSDLKEDWQQE